MTINTAFINGDKAWAIVQGYKPEQVTIGQIRVRVTNGSLVEEYMAVETGIGGDIVYELGDNIFAKLDECQRAIEQRKAKVLEQRIREALEKIFYAASSDIYEIMGELQEIIENKSEAELFVIQKFLNLLEQKNAILSDSLSEIRLLKYNKEKSL